MIMVGDKVETAIVVAGERRPMASGIIMVIYDGYCEVDIMSLHGGAPWIVSCETHLLRKEERKP